MVRTIKNINIDQTPKKLLVDIEIDQGNKYIISKSKIINNIAIR
jgi:hypothetical protein